MIAAYQMDEVVMMKMDLILDAVEIKWWELLLVIFKSLLVKSLIVLITVITLIFRTLDLSFLLVQL